MSLKSKLPSYPDIQPARVISSFARGGCTSTKYCDLMYLDANLPKCTSSNLSAAKRQKSAVYAVTVKRFA